MTTGSVARHLAMFAIPMLLGNGLHTAYSIVNAIWVGRYLGTAAMAAVTNIFPILFFLMAIAGGLTLASSILISQAYGAKDFKRVKDIIQNSLVLVGAVTLCCMAIGFIEARDILVRMNTPADVLPLAVSYLRLTMLTIPFMFGIFLLASAMRGVGDSKTPLYFQAGSLLSTAILDPLLIFGLLGFPKLGLNGTVVANFISQAAGVIALIVYLKRRQHIAAPRWPRLGVDTQLTLVTLKLGVPSMAQQALVSLGILFVVGFVNGFGEHSAAAFGIASRLDQVAFMPAMALGMAVSTLTGQNVGAGRYERVPQVLAWGVIMSLSITLIGCVMALGFPDVLMHMFAKDNDVIAIGAHYLRIAAFGYIMVAVMFISNGVINGSGHTLATTFFTVITFWLVRVPLAAILSKELQDVEGIWYAIVASMAVGMFISLAYYMSGLWRRPVHGAIRKSPPAES